MDKGANVLVQSKVLEVKVALGNLWNHNAESIDLLDNGGMLKEVLQDQRTLMKLGTFVVFCVWLRIL